MSRHTIRNTRSASSVFTAKLSAQGRLRRLALISGMGLSVLAPLAFSTAAHAGAPVGSPAWFAQRGNGTAAPGAGTPAAGGNPLGGVTTPQQAQIQAQRSIQDLNRAMTAISNMRAAQAAAHSAAQQISVADGLAAGGLVPDSGLDPTKPNSANTVTTWVNANTPTQTTGSDGKVTVDVKQTGQYAILNWQSFNVGKNTTLDFDQSQGTQANGGNNWVALNRVDASAAPSQILGNIKADGSVYLINQNGIIFGGSSQVNVHSLVASTLSLYSKDPTTSNNTFLKQGLLGVSNDPILVSDPAQAYGNVKIEQGASISSGVSGGAGGFTLIAGPNVSNAGTLTSTDGQIILAAGTAVTLTNTAATANSTPGLLKPVVDNNTYDHVTGKATAGDLSNTGLIETTRGQVMLAGSSVEQDGVVAVTTSVSRPGSIIIDAVLRNPQDEGSDILGVLRFGANSVTAVLPQEDGETTTSSNTATAQFQPGSATFTAGSITFQNGSLVEAPGATVSAIAGTTLGGGFILTPAADQSAVQGRVYVDTGAIIDVAGIANIELPVADTLLTIGPLTANDLADSPLNAGGLLYGQSITIDITMSGVRADGKPWVGSPLVDASAYVQNIPRTIDQLLVNGGTIKLAGKEVIAAKGSVLNLDGGYTHYLGGMVNTTKLLGADGHIYDISEADPNIVYVAFAGVDTVSHPRWNITESFVNPVLSGHSGLYEPDFIQGGKGGTLDIYASSTVVLDGNMSAKAMAGRNQVASGSPPPGGILQIGTDTALGKLAYPGVSNAPPLNANNYVIVDRTAGLSELIPGFDADTSLATPGMLAKSQSDTSNLLYWSAISANSISNGGFSGVNIGSTYGQTVVDHGANLTVQPGGSVNLSGAALTVYGDITARSGSITLTSSSQTGSLPGSTAAAPLTGDITVYGKLDASGAWVNDTGLVADQRTGNAYIDGGSITLNTLAGISTANVDTTGSIVLAQGSTLDVSSGGYVRPDGSLQMSNGLVAGKGGDISLQTYMPGSQGFGGVTGHVPDLQPNGGHVTMDGNLQGYGFAGGGTFTLHTLDLQIGGDPATAPSYATVLAPDFFTQHGFGNYVLQAEYDATVVSGTSVKLSQQNLIPTDYSGLLHAATGSDVRGSGLATVGTLDPYYRPATNLSLTSGYYLTEWNANPNGGTPPSGYAGVSGTTLLAQGASINADAGAKVTLGSVNQVTVLGSITAHGGNITLTGDDTSGGLAPVISPGATAGPTGISNTNRSVWLGADAKLDASGIALIQPVAAPAQPGDLVALGGQGWVYLSNLPKPETIIGNPGAGNPAIPTSGRVLDGGHVTLTNDTGYVIAQSGAVIDVSGASASLDLPQTQHNSAGDALVYAPTTVSSDGGTITLATGGGLYTDATLQAAAGGPQGEGGTLVIRPYSSTAALLPGTSYTGATGLIIRQSGDSVPQGLQPGQSTAAMQNGNGAPSGTLYFSADELNGSGIGTLVVGSDTSGGHSTLAPIAFAGDVKLKLGTAFVANASQYIALPAGSTVIPTPAAGVGTVGGGTVEIDAPYVSLSGNYLAAGSGTFKPVASHGDATLKVNASFIDIGGVFGLDNFGDANFTSSGDIRFLTPAQYAYTPTATTPSPGVLYTSGNLTFTAGQVYPTSGNSFIIDANAQGLTGADGKPIATTVSFQSYTGASNAVPLSAGGSLLVDADHIVQDGTLRAPAGTIVLGVGDPNDAAVKTTFANPNNLPLVATQTVTLGAGSLTSVSLDGATVPYGVTVDGVQWQYPGNPLLSTPPDLTAPPSKLISLNGASVTLEDGPGGGAKVDLSGGGKLQATEWVPGSGGTRDVLSQSGISYTNDPAGTLVYQYPDMRGIYAIIPSGRYYSASGPVKGGVAAYDPVVNKGQAPINAGQSVYLTGIAGLPAGWYTLLPAQYATLPGAYRLVQDPGSDALPANNMVLPDGTYRVAGYLGNSLSGSQASRSAGFEVQSAAVWGKYSEYTRTDANTYFPALAAGKGTITPQLPQDAGHLILGASDALQLGQDTVIDTAPAPGSKGAAAQIDIASQDIQIGGGQELAGYVQLDPSTLEKLGAGSLLIGGTRQSTSSGVTITALANDIRIDTSQDQPLQGPEIILVTHADGNAGDGIHVGAGSVIRASGSIAPGADVPIVVDGGGSLLRVSNGANVAMTRSNPTQGGPGLLEIGAGASIDGGQALTLDSTGNVLMDPTASLSAKSITADSGSISFVSGNGASAPAGLVIGPQTLAQLGNADSVTLRSYGDIDFVGDVNIQGGKNLTLSAGTFKGDGAVTISAGSNLMLDNELAAPQETAAAGNGSLALSGGQVLFGSGKANLSGFGSVDVTAQQAIAGSGTGTMDFGAAPVSLTAPALIAASGANTTLQTSGALSINQGAGTAPAAIPFGGALTLKGGSIADNGTIELPAGKLTLEATSGNLVIGQGAMVSVAGVSRQFFDVTAYAPGGRIALTADQGQVQLQSGSTLDFSGAQGGGAAGSLVVSSPKQAAQLDGTLKGTAAAGNDGGSFTLDVGGSADLDQLAALLAAGGIDNQVLIHTRQGNLDLSAGSTLKAGSVILVADSGQGGAPSAAAGNILIAGTIDASGNSGGSIQLFGGSGVDLEGSLLASASGAGQSGGKVIIGTSGVADTQGGVVQFNSQYGYENISAGNSGTIKLGNGALIDVSAGASGTGGTVSLRAPLLTTGDVNVDVAGGTQIRGARDVGLEAYAIWSTTDPGNGPRHFDGIVDPAGWFDSQGHLLPGTFTDQAGNTIVYDGTNLTDAQIAQYLAADYFTPDAINTDHAGFYGFANGDPAQGPGTLMGFVQQPGFKFENRFAAIPNFHARPGIELDNPSSSINQGNISVLSNWNLGAGETDSQGNIAQRYFRYGDQAPVVTMRAANNLKINASLSDGFFQFGNPLTVLVIPTPVDQSTAEMDYQTLLSNVGIDPNDPLIRPPVQLNGDQSEVEQYYGFYAEYVNYLGTVFPPDFNTPGGVLTQTIPSVGMQDYPGQPKPPATPTSLAEYPAYFLAYQAYFLKNYQIWVDGGYGFYPTTVPMVAPPPELVPVLTQGTLVIPPGLVATNNSVSPQPAAGNALALASANLVGGNSSSYRLVAGADLSSANPLALQSAATFGAGGTFAGGGNVTLDGHFGYSDSATSRIVEAPTMVRTGTGSIDIAAGNDFSLVDPVAPGVVYSAGAPAPGTSASTQVSLLQPSQIVGATTGTLSVVEMVVTGPVNPVGGGDVSIHAQHDVHGGEQVYDTDGSITGAAGNYIGQFWWPWMQTGNTAASSSINFGAFDQGVMSVGGNVDISAGNNISDLSVSLPTTWRIVTDGSGKQSVQTLGGGNLKVNASGDILSGSYFVAKGSGSISAGGNIGSDFSFAPLNDLDKRGNQLSTSVSTLLALQDAQLLVTARGTLDIGGVYNPSYYADRNTQPVFSSADGQPDSQSYGVNSSLNLHSTAGNVLFDTLLLPYPLMAYGGGTASRDADADNGQVGLGLVLPANLNLTALQGGIAVNGPGELYPSPTGNLSLLAADSISFGNNVYQPLGNNHSYFGLIDIDQASMPSPLNPGVSNDKINLTDSNIYQLHDADLLHAGDNQPVRIYSLDGDISDGVLGPAGFNYNQLILVPDKAANLYAGGDIVNLVFIGQNLTAADVTRIVAKGNIYDTPLANKDRFNFSPYPTNYGYSDVPVLELSGPGYFDVEAGGSIGPLSNVTQEVAQGYVAGTNPTGIISVGNLLNPYLPRQSASISVLFGVSPSLRNFGQGTPVLDDQAFIQRYLAPGAPGAADFVADGIDFGAALKAFMQQYESARTGKPVSLSTAQAWTDYQALPGEAQQLFVEQAFFRILKATGADYNEPGSVYFHQYARGYQAINTLFPPADGYTANALSGGANGATTPVPTGNLDLRGSTIQTQQGGSIYLFGPGGQALLGSALAPPVLVNADGSIAAGPNSSGVLTLEQGDINIFTDQSLLLAQSRIFTEQGGDMVIWSSNGDINAGKGVRTSSAIPPVQYLCDRDNYCVVDDKGQVSGAGIATLQTVAGAPPGTVYLVAPRGTVDAGAAGIRVSGNLIVAAQSVANAFNIEVKGKEVGVPTNLVNVGAINAATSAAAAAEQSADAVANRQRTPPETTISVEIVGFGQPDEEQKKRLRRKGL